MVIQTAPRPVSRTSIQAAMSGLVTDWLPNVNSSAANATDCTEWNSTTLANATDACSTNDNTVSFQLNMIRLIVLIPSCIIILTCLCVLVVLLKLPELRDITNALIINSALADLLRGFIGLLNTYLYIRPLPANDVNYVLCKIFLFSHLFQGLWSSWSMSILAYDRYDLLAHPLRRTLRAKRLAIILAILFVFDVFLCSTPFLGWSEYLFYRLPSNPDLVKCRLSQQETNTADWAFLPTFDVCAYIIPFVVTIVIYGKMIMLVVSHIRKRQETLRLNAASRSRLQSTRANTNTNTNTNTNLTQEFSNTEAVQMRELQTNGSHAALQADKSTNVEHTSTPLLIIKSKAFRLVIAVTASNILLTLPFIFVVQFEKFRVIVIKVFPDVMKSVLMAVYHCNFVINSIIYIFWVQNAVRMAARQGFQRQGFQRHGFIRKLIGLCCLAKEEQMGDA